jgi:hypothetical protein
LLPGTPLSGHTARFSAALTTPENSLTNSADCPSAAHYRARCRTLFVSSNGRRLVESIGILGEEGKTLAGDTRALLTISSKPSRALITSSTTAPPTRSRAVTAKQRQISRNRWVIF